MDTLETGDAAASVRAAFSWSYRQLAGPAARMFRLLAAHPGPAITDAAAASLAGVPREDARARLRDLSDAHLVMEPEAGRFALHDLMRSFAAEVPEAGRPGTPKRSAASWAITCTRRARPTAC